MEQITIRIQDKQKARRLLDLLKLLDFIDSIEANETIIVGSEEVNIQQEEDDFFALAGLWQGRDIEPGNHSQTGLA